jgi:2-polyprenyl-3-methyl-5-hydroxy-6-metoxy-1,4-benzoquinol methylase
MEAADVLSERSASLETMIVPCPVCKSADYHAVGKENSQWPQLQRDYTVVQCDECGCRYLNPRLTDESLSLAYSLIQEALPPTAAYSTARGGLLTRMWRHYGSYQVADAITEGPVLDLGCNQGELLEELRDKGLNASGVEFSPEAVAWCRNLGLDVVEGGVEDFEIERGKFRTIVLSHVLEHLADPVRVLKRIASSLDETGTLVICVPNVDSPTRRLFGPNWHGWDPPFHLVHYDEATLRAVCKRAGLTVTRTVKRMIPEDVRRSLLLWQGRSGRHLLLRGLTIPVLAFLTLFGFGSYLLVTAKLDSGR